MLFAANEEGQLDADEAAIGGASRGHIEGLAAGIRSRQNKTLAHTLRLGGDPFQNGDIDLLEARRQRSGRLRPDDLGEGNRRNERFKRETIMVALFVRTQHHQQMLSSMSSLAAQDRAQLHLDTKQRDLVDPPYRELT
jgi:hypothetical protein